MCKPRWSILLLSAGILLVAAGCTVCSTKKVPCNAFSDAEFDSWFPYSINSGKTFRNLSSGDTTTFVFNQLNASAPYDATIGGYGGGSKACNAAISINANGYNGRDYMSVQYQVDSPFSGAGKSYYFTLALSNGVWNAGKINATSFEAIPGGRSTTASASNVLFENGVLYSNVVIITNDTSNPEKPAFYKVTIAKGKGVVGYEAYPSLEKWVIQ